MLRYAVERRSICSLTNLIWIIDRRLNWPTSIESNFKKLTVNTKNDTSYPISFWCIFRYIGQYVNECYIMCGKRTMWKACSSLDKSRMPVWNWKFSKRELDACTNRGGGFEWCQRSNFQSWKHTSCYAKPLCSAAHWYVPLTLYNMGHFYDSLVNGNAHTLRFALLICISKIVAYFLLELSHLSNYHLSAPFYSIVFKCVFVPLYLFDKKTPLKISVNSSIMS